MGYAKRDRKRGERYIELLKDSPLVYAVTI